MKKVFDYKKCINEINFYYNGIRYSLFDKIKIINIIKSNINIVKSIKKYKDKNGHYDLPIGTKFLYKGKKYIVEVQFSCLGCGFFKECPKEIAWIKAKCGFNRKDNTPVYFKEIK
jgi:hypothetical protein